MFKWLRRSTLDPLSVSMAGAKLGDRLLVVGCGDPALIAALAAKTGLTGRACAVDESPDRAGTAGRLALEDGALVETSSAPLDALPFEAASFDLVLLRDVLNRAGADARPAVVQEARRVLRPGGRCMVIDTAARAAMDRVFSKKPTGEPSREADALSALLAAQGFVAVRTLAEREGLIFVEGIEKNL